MFPAIRRLAQKENSHSISLHFLFIKRSDIFLQEVQNPQTRYYAGLYGVCLIFFRYHKGMSTGLFLFLFWEMAQILSTAYPHLLSHEATSGMFFLGIFMLCSFQPVGK